MNRVLCLCAVLALALGCAGDAPNANTLDLARESVAVAERLKAERYAPEDLEVARQALAEAEDEHRKQGKRLWFLRKAKRADELSQKAADLAAVALEKAKDGTIQAAKDARSGMSSAEAVVLDLKGSLARLYRCRENKASTALTEYAKQLKALQDDQRSSEKDYDAGEYEALTERSQRIVEVGEKVLEDIGHDLRGCD